MRKLIPYLQLMRLPAVFSALSDIFTGYLLTWRTLEHGWYSFGCLLVASAGLYLAGMVFNDVFDRKIDAVERPGRPIPSGRVPLKTAVILGSALLGIGLIAAACAGVPSLIMAGLLVAAIFAYDGLLKSTPLGPLAMGTCRFLNVMLGTSVAPVGFAELWVVPHVHVAAGLGVYIAGVTLFARQEAGTSSARGLTAGIGVVNLGFALLAAYMLNVPGQFRVPIAVLALGMTALTIDRRLFAALFTDRSPGVVQTAVKTMLMSYIMLNAALVLHITGSPTYTFSVIGLLVPAFLLGRWMSIT